MVGAVRTRRSFTALSRSRTRGRSGPLWVVRADADDAGDGRTGPTETDAVCVAYAIGKSVGPAVVRNRLRRRLRVLVAELDPDAGPTGTTDDDGSAPQLPEGLYLVGATPSAVGLGFDELRHHLRRAVRSVA